MCAAQLPVLTPEFIQRTKVYGKEMRGKVECRLCGKYAEVNLPAPLDATFSEYGVGQTVVMLASTCPDHKDESGGPIAMID